MKKNSGASVDQLESWADEHLSYYGGNESEMDSFQGEDMFQGEDLYEGGSSMFDKVSENFFVGKRAFVITLTNTATTARTCYFLPGLSWYPGITTNGYAKDGAFNDIAGDAGLSGAGSPETLAYFYDFLRGAPVQIIGFKVTSNISTAQLEKIITWEPQSPFANLGNIPMILGTAQTDQTYRDKIAGPFKVPANLPAAREMRAKLQIEPASGGTNNIVTLTFYCGLIDNQTVKLVNAARRTR